MLNKAPSLCTAPHCPKYSVYRGKCVDHKATQYRDRYAKDKHTKRFYGTAKWQAFRKLMLDARPMCEWCRVTSAHHVHHIAEQYDRPDLAYTAANVQCLCASCHSKVRSQSGNRAPVGEGRASDDNNRFPLFV